LLPATAAATLNTLGFQVGETALTGPKLVQGLKQQAQHDHQRQTERRPDKACIATHIKEICDLSSSFFLSAPAVVLPGPGIGPVVAGKSKVSAPARQVYLCECDRKTRRRQPGGA